MPGGFIQVAKHSSSSSSSSSSPSSFSSLSSSSLSSSSSASSYIHLHHLSYRFQSLSFVVNPLTPRQETICLLQVSLTLNFQILNPIHLQIFNNTLNIVLTSLLNSFFAKHFFTEHLITEWYSSEQPVSAAPQGSQPVLHGKPYFVSQYQLYHIVNFILSASITW